MRPDESQDTEILMRGYFQGEERWRYLNSLGYVFSDQGKNYLALMCLLESLRIHPFQPEIFERCEHQKRIAGPEYLKEDSTCETMISVIMGTYNRMIEIRDSIQSVLDQTFRDFELIVINDGGPDEVEDIVSSFGSSKIRYYKLSRNRGHAVTLNEGIKRARGRYIAYLDDDDVYYSDHLKNFFNTMRTSKEKILYSNTKFVKGDIENGKFLPNKTLYIWKEKHDKNKLLLNNYISNLGVMHERSIFSTVGLFSEDFNVIMDWEMWLRASLKFEFHHLDMTTGEYRLTGKNITTTNRLAVDFYTIMIRNYYSYYKGLVPLIRYKLHYGGKSAASSMYRKIKDIYEGYFKASPSLNELLEISMIYEDDVFLRKILRDYVEVDPRNCIKDIQEKRSLKMVSMILPFLPGKVAKKIRNKIHKVIVN